MGTESILMQFWNYFWAYARFPNFWPVLGVLIPIAVLAWWWQRS